MYFLKSPKFLIFLIVFVNFLGYGIVFPILPLLTVEYGGDPIISGVLIAIFSLMQVISMPILGRLSDRYGRRPLLLFSLWGTVVSFAMMGLTHSIFWLLVARIIDGISGGNISIASAYIADITDKKDRAGGMGVLAAGISLGFIIGPLWGGFFSGISLSAPFIAATILTIISVILTQFFLPESLSKKEFIYEKKHFQFSQVWNNIFHTKMFIFYMMFMLIFWAQSGVFTTISLFGKDVLNLSVGKVSLIFAFGGILSAVIQGFGIGKVVKIVGEEKLLIISSVIAVAGFSVMSYSHTAILLVFGMIVLSVGNSYITPVVQSLVSERSSAHEQGGVMGIMQSYGSVGRIFGPITAGFIYEKVSPFSPSIMGAVIMCMIFILSIKILARGKSAK